LEDSAKNVVPAGPSYVIKGEELPALPFLNPAHPKPVALEWINRGTDQKLKPSTVRMLLRTADSPGASDSVLRQHEAMGLRATFASDADRSAFAAAFTGAVANEAISNGNREAAFFPAKDAADAAILELVAGGIDPAAISALARSETAEPVRGHSRLRVASATAGGGLAGALLGMVLLTIPGIGLVAAFGSIAGVLGATGGALAVMLSDIDVDGRDPEEIERKLAAGRTFVSVNVAGDAAPKAFVRKVLDKNGGSKVRLGPALYGIAKHFEEILHI
jgi:hypothetical protein